jgi:hypothetical protein
MVALAALLLLAAVSQVAAQAYPHLEQSTLDYSGFSGNLIACNLLSQCDRECIQGGYDVNPYSKQSAFADFVPRSTGPSSCNSAPCATGVAEATSATTARGTMTGGAVSGEVLTIVQASLGAPVQVTLAGCTLSFIVAGNGNFLAPAPAPGVTQKIDARMSDSLESATKSSSAGIAVSALFAALIVIAALFTPFRPSAARVPGPLGALWKYQAIRGRPLFLFGFGFMTFGLLFCAAAPAIPWIAGSVSVDVSDGVGNGNTGTAAWTITGLMFDITTCAAAYYNTGGPNALCRSKSFVNVFMLGGSALIYAGLALFVFPAWAMAFAATRSVMQLSSESIMPPMGCCLPSMPAIQGCGWFGLIIVTIGGAINWSLRAVYGAVTGGSTMAGAGGNLLGVGVFCLFLANIIFSVASCCTSGGVHNLPGIGRARKSCCCVERELVGPDGEPLAGPASVTVVSVRDKRLDAIKTSSDEYMRQPAVLASYPVQPAYQQYAAQNGAAQYAQPVYQNPILPAAR